MRGGGDLAQPKRAAELPFKAPPAKAPPALGAVGWLAAPWKALAGVLDLPAGRMPPYA